MKPKSIPDIFFRPATKDDIPELVALDHLCFSKQQAYGANVFADILDWRGALHIVAERKGKIIGFVAGIPDKIFVHMTTLDVHPDFRRKNLGNGLMEMIENMSKDLKVKLIVLEVGFDNTPAIELYLARGYTTNGTLKNYYANGEHAYVMSKLLA